MVLERARVRGDGRAGSAGHLAAGKAAALKETEGERQPKQGTTGAPAPPALSHVWSMIGRSHGDHRLVERLGEAQKSSRPGKGDAEEVPVVLEGTTSLLSLEGISGENSPKVPSNGEHERLVLN